MKCVHCKQPYAVLIRTCREGRQVVRTYACWGCSRQWIEREVLSLRDIIPAGGDWR